MNGGFDVESKLFVDLVVETRLPEGSLYPALHRMKQAGWVRASWGSSDNGRRARYYEITADGRRQLAEEKKKWAELTGAVSRVMRHA